MDAGYCGCRYGVQIRAYLPLALCLDRGQERYRGAGREMGIQMWA